MFLKKNKQIKDFDVAFNGYRSEKNLALHKKAIQWLLKEVDLQDAFDELLSKKNGIGNFFLMWKTAGKLEKNTVDKKGLQRLGKLSKKFYSKKEYKKLYELFFDMMLHSLAEFADLESLRIQKDFPGFKDPVSPFGVPEGKIPGLRGLGIIEHTRQADFIL